MFGGTFDPIHIGHLAAAEAVRQVGLVEVVERMPDGLDTVVGSEDVLVILPAMAGGN